MNYFADAVYARIDERAILTCRLQNVNFSKNLQFLVSPSDIPQCVMYDYEILLNATVGMCAKSSNDSLNLEIPKVLKTDAGTYRLGDGSASNIVGDCATLFVIGMFF